MRPGQSPVGKIGLFCPVGKIGQAGDPGIGTQAKPCPLGARPGALGTGRGALVSAPLLAAPDPSSGLQLPLHLLLQGLSGSGR